MAAAVNVSATNNAEIDGLLSGYKWSGTITYSFPDSPSDYANPYSGGSSEPTTSGFASAPIQMQAAINYAIGLILGYTNANIQYAGTNGADIMVAQSPSANPTSYAYYPGNYASGGDIWFGTQYNYSLAALGNYYFTTALHELGHAFGLKHSQETGGPANVGVPSAHDDSEYTVMSYRSYVGASTTSGYTNEAYGYPQTYMANDILALQTMYGANYTTQGGATVYTWSQSTGQEFINGVAQLAPGGGAGGSANRIYETVWDGGGVDTYDLSNYTTNLSINLNPGASSVFSSVQLANLGNGHYASGNVYNAYLYNGDARSYIDNATGGSGNDTIIGNAIANVLNGGSGNDTITGGGGNDTIIGGTGTDTAVYSGNRANFALAYNAGTQTITLTDQRSSSPDGTDTVTGVENFQFADGTLSSTTLISQLTPVVIEAIGTTSLVQQGGNYFLNPTAGGIGPTLKYQGSPVEVGQFSDYAPIGAEQISSGYEVAWKNTATGQYSVWSTDINVNYTGNLFMPGSGGAIAFENLETSFHQDLNGDGVIGPPVPIVVEAAGSIELDQLGNHYFLSPVGGGSGPKLLYQGSAVTVGELGDYVPIGAEAVSNGYEVAWKNATTGQYSVWSTDASGNYTGNFYLPGSGHDAAFETLESSFHQDLNGDGIVGLVRSAISSSIEAIGTTALDFLGGNYLLDPIAGGTGPTLKYHGIAVTAGQFGDYAPLGVEQISNGYEVAWKNATTGQYSVWSTDTNGNYTGNLYMPGPGNATAFEALETSFQQDLNGDGTIGVPQSVIEAIGTTALVYSGDNYVLNPVGGGAGPMLKYGGSAVTAGQFGNYVPIGAEAVSNGYEVAWKNATTGQYSVWSTDSNGNYTGNFYMPGSGNTSAFQSQEISFQQDLNGDGTIGTPSHSTTVASATVAGDGFTFAAGASELSSLGHIDTSQVRTTVAGGVINHSEAGTVSSPGELIVDDSGHQSTLHQDLQGGFILYH
ncbi:MULTISPECIES: M10 family metallopeptidase C-terminal domain-containing protein [unclassified Bradyrhizobium]|uniref:M10 family metallopeptidase C-terminal domain-containing protein n=1 Tax=unclassified Bradyrhizobium TaxID=2631580 RepID=UPI001FFB2651|nr:MULTISPECIES: M10 family metallopeptidase C-terminal domain-containing protein [unclassified Bradyrhizobium]MCK1614360.1 M10 family metallopeptidase C-terminal domain-containing protein [Bradyrhizobium sp. 163]MCK1765648.1 M10 family metallopeptidase C-terminal domain-containing protein [Bradyrhizobium sp. 136]